MNEWRKNWTGLESWKTPGWKNPAFIGYFQNLAGFTNLEIERRNKRRKGRINTCMRNGWRKEWGDAWRTNLWSTSETQQKEKEDEGGEKEERRRYPTPQRWEEDEWWISEYDKWKDDALMWINCLNESNSVIWREHRPQLLSVYEAFLAPSNLSFKTSIPCYPIATRRAHPDPKRQMNVSVESTRHRPLWGRCPNSKPLNETYQMLREKSNDLP